MRRLITVLTAAAVLVALTTLVRAPAEAASPRLRISNATSASIGWDGRATITAKITKAKKTRVLKRSIAAYQHGSLRARGRKVSLPAGTYRVRIAVTWKHRGKVHTSKRSMRVRVAQGACATAADFRRLRTDPTYSASVRADSTATVAARLRSPGTVGERTTVASRISTLEGVVDIIDDSAMRGQTRALIAQLSSLQAKGVEVREDRKFRGCGGKRNVYASFADGELVEAEAF